MSHITEKDYNRYLTLGYGSVPTLVKDIHFNDKKPENHNILLPRGDCNDIYVYNNEDEWECKDKNVLIEQLIADKTNLLSKKRDEKDDNKKFSFDNYYESYEEQNEKKMKTVIENVKRICLTGKDKVMKTKKLVIKN
jgi:competence CoiA-like predicted nuclease